MQRLRRAEKLSSRLTAKVGRCCQVWIRKGVETAKVKQQRREVHTAEAEFKAIEVAATEFEMGSVFEIFKEAIIPRKISKMDIETATSKEVILIGRGLMYEKSVGKPRVVSGAYVVSWNLCCAGI